MLLRRASKEAKPQLPRSCPHTFFVEPSPTSPLLLVVSNIAYIATALGGSSFAYESQALGRHASCGDER